ncbi:hypothetical protein ACQ86D_23430 [Streptomyces galilaeus]
MQARTKGVAVIFVTHKVRHAMMVGDHFAVLIRGQKAGDFRKGERTREQITDLMASGEAMAHLEAELAQLQAEGHRGMSVCGRARHGRQPCPALARHRPSAGKMPDMTKDKRPWDRPQPKEVPDVPQAEDGIGVFRYKGADILNMTDAQVRAFCLERVKYFLYEAQVKAADIIGGPELNVAAQYATIADAFRLSLGPIVDGEGEPEADRRG